MHSEMLAEPQDVKATKVSVRRRVFLKGHIISQPSRHCPQQEQYENASLTLLASHCHHLPRTGCNKHNPFSFKLFSSRRNGGRKQSSLPQIPSINHQVACLLLRIVHSLHLHPVVCCLDVAARFSSERDCSSLPMLKQEHLCIRASQGYSDTSKLVHMVMFPVQTCRQLPGSSCNSSSTHLL